MPSGTWVASSAAAARRDRARRPVDEDEADQVRAGLDGDREVVGPVDAADLDQGHPAPTSSWISSGVAHQRGADQRRVAAGAP